MGLFCGVSKQGRTALQVLTQDLTAENKTVTLSSAWISAAQQHIEYPTTLGIEKLICQFFSLRTAKCSGDGRIQTDMGYLP